MAANTEAEVLGLSGHEIITDLLFQVENHLKRDCNLTAMCAYEGGYYAKVHVEMRLHGIDTAIVNTQYEVGTKTSEPGTTIDETVEVSVDERLDVVRQRSEQPKPSMQRDDSAPVEPAKRRYQKQVPHPIQTSTDIVRGDGGATGEQLERE